MDRQEKTLKSFAKWCDDRIDFKKLVKGGVGTGLEMVDGFVFGAIIRFAFDKAKDEHKEEILSIMESIVSGDFNMLLSVSTDRLVMLLKTGLGDEREYILIYGVLRTIGEFVDSYRK